MKALDLSKELALKLGDPITDNGDGKLFYKADRYNYLERALGRLNRILKTIMGDAAPRFATNLRYFSADIPNNGSDGRDIVLKESTNEIVPIKILTLYPTISGRSELCKANYIKPEQYVDTKNGLNTDYLVTEADAVKKGSTYYTILNGKINLLPILKDAKYTAIEMIYQGDTVGNLTEDSDVEVFNEYKDLLLGMAAKEGMMDLGRTDKVSLYTSDINNELSALNIHAQVEQKNAGEVNGQ